MLWPLSLAACAVPVASPSPPTQPTCVWPACVLRLISLRGSPSKSQWTSASSVKGLFHVPYFFSTHLFQDTKNTSLYPYRKHLQVQLFQIFCLYGWGLNVHRPPPCRYLQPPATWMQCALESRELLALCLKKIKSSMTKVSVIRTKLQKAHFQSQKCQWTLQVNSHVCIVSIVLPWFFQPYVIFMFNVFLLSWTSSS